MKFEIVGELTSIETIATGRSIRILPLVNKLRKKDGGGRRKGSRWSNFKMEVIGKLRYTSMKPTG